MEITTASTASFDGEKQPWQCPGCKTWYAPSVTSCACQSINIGKNPYIPYPDWPYIPTYPQPYIGDPIGWNDPPAWWGIFPPSHSPYITTTTLSFGSGAKFQ